MGLTDMHASEETRALLVHAPAERFLHGCVRTGTGPDGWVRPWRIGEAQLRVLGSCMSWHPGLFRQMAETTAGIVVAFRTNSSEIGLELSFDPEPKGTRAVLADVDGAGAELPHDGASCVVDGRKLASVPAREGRTFAVWQLGEEGDHPEWGLQPLPGFGPEHIVRIWLPCLRGATLGEVWGDGTTLEPVEARPSLLVLGDSIAQGFVADDPGSVWVHELAERQGMDVFNQSIGGQVFQHQFVETLPDEIEPARILVELGANYRFEPYPEARMRQDISAFLSALRRRYPDVPVQAITPMAHREERYPTHPRSCFAAVPAAIAELCGRFDIEAVDGAHLVDGGAASFADSDHPGPAAQERIVDRLELVAGREDASQEELAARAARLLAKAPRRAFPLLDAAKRGVGRWLFVQEGCILLEHQDGLQMVYAPDHELGRDVLALWGSRKRLALQEPALRDFVREELGLSSETPYHLAIYKGKRKISVPGRFHIERLDVSAMNEVLALTEGAGEMSAEELRRALAAGGCLGGRDENGLCGFIGLRPEGSIGLLAVKPACRRLGWASALEGTLVNRLLAEGRTPWATISPDGRSALRLHAKLGFEVTPADEQFLCEQG